MFLPSDITLRPGDSGDHVSELQRRLSGRDLLSEGEITGFYDGGTTNAVMAFQSMQGIRSDGIAGPETLRRLNNLSMISDSDNSSSSSSDAEEEEHLVGASRNAEMYYAHQLTDGLSAGQLSAISPLVDDVDQVIEREVSSDKSAKPDFAQAQQQQVREVERTLDRDITQSVEQMRPPVQDKQLEITRDGIRAANPLESLDKPIVPTETRDQARSTELEAQRQPENDASRQPAQMLISKEPAPQREPDASRDRVPQAETARAPDARQEPVLTTAKPLRDPQLSQTEAKLTPSGRDESQATGRKLDGQGVENNGTVSMAQLGTLSPSQTPTVGQQQQIGIG